MFFRCLLRRWPAWENALQTYSLLTIDIKDDTAPGDPYHFQLNTTLGEIGNLGDVVHGLVNDGLGGALVGAVDALLLLVQSLSFGLISLDVSDLLDAITGVVLDIPIVADLPIALPLLDIVNLTLTGSWSDPEPWSGD